MIFMHAAGRIWRRQFRSDWQPHPIDRQYGIETSGRLSRIEIWTGSPVDASNIGYVGVQPSVLRHCLEILAIKPGDAFVDLGCGKGRALAVATEYKFTQIIGVEISPVLCKIARRNGSLVAAGFPERTAAQIVEGDAAAFSFPTATTVYLFLYNSFDRPLVEKLLRHIELRLSRSPDLTVFLIYYNPVHFDLVDASPAFSRYFAKRIRYDADEQAVSPFSSSFDSVVIYESRSAHMRPPWPDAQAVIRVTVPRLGADVAEPPTGLR